MRRLGWPCGITGALVVLGGVVWATTYHSITVDGNLSDFAADEKLPGDPAGDSRYAANNDLTTLHVTWDAQKLYLGFEYRANNAAVIYLLETNVPGGVTEFCGPSAGAYTGAFPGNYRTSEGMDLMVAFFADADPTKPATYPDTQVYSLASGSASDISGAAQINRKETVDTSTGPTRGDRVGVVELAIPWLSIYPGGSGYVPTGGKLKIAGVLRGSQDWDNLGDVSPDPSQPLGTELCGNGPATLIDRFHQVTVDANHNGAPDPGWSPAQTPDSGPSPDTQRVPDSRVGDLHPPADHPAQKKDGSLPRKDSSAAIGDAGRGELAPRKDAASSADKRVTKADGGTKQNPPAEEGCACTLGQAEPRSAAATPALALLLLLVVRLRRRR